MDLSSQVEKLTDLMNSLKQSLDDFFKKNSSRVMQGLKDEY